MVLLKIRMVIKLLKQLLEELFFGEHDLKLFVAEVFFCDFNTKALHEVENAPSLIFTMIFYELFKF